MNNRLNKEQQEIVDSFTNHNNKNNENYIDYNVNNIKDIEYKKNKNKKTQIKETLLDIKKFFKENKLLWYMLLLSIFIIILWQFILMMLNYLQQI